ncbi:MAG: hypothetical protein AAGK67_11650 [Pseudomonadota bacterium]
MIVTAQRFPDNPIIRPGDCARIGDNINGPSLIRVPDWVKERLGKYYLYFAHHVGSFIRMAYADHLAGPWRVHEAGILDLEQCPQFHDHIASPDVLVDDKTRTIRMYFHGVSGFEPAGDPQQRTSLAVSDDGLRFAPQQAILGESYFRVWQWQESYYAISLNGVLWRSADAQTPFERGNRLNGLPKDTRHSAIMIRERKFWIAWSAIGDCPERIFIGAFDAALDWQDWTLENVQELLRPKKDWEGANEPLVASEIGIINGAANQLRDPAFFSDDGRDYLVYSVAGESGLALAELNFEGAS